MAQAYPKSRFWGFDGHEASIRAAREAAAAAGVADRVTFEVADASAYPGHDYDLICFFDCLHDMGRPVDAAGHAKKTLASDGTVMLVEPFAADRLEDNINPVGRLLLCSVDDAVLCARDFREWYARARCPGRRGAARTDLPQGRIPPLPPGRPDAVQPHS